MSKRTTAQFPASIGTDGPSIRFISNSTTMDRATPSPFSNALFRAKVFALQGRRLGEDTLSRPKRFAKAEVLPPDVLLEVRSSLWREQDPREWANEQGKVQNLRVAARYLDRLSIPAGEVFSFWKHLGRTTRGKGFVQGRQIQEGCLIPARGGGICQLTNLLYEAALGSGCQIVERHPHTRKVAGAPTNKPDATVAWNHIDLRFSPRQDVVLRVVLTSTDLIVQILGERVSKRTPLALLQDRPSKSANSCASCGMDDCFRYKEVTVSRGRRAVLVDMVWPEYVAYLREQGLGDDVFFAPLDHRRLKRSNYAWPLNEVGELHTSTLDTLARAWRSRKLAGEGPARRRAALESDEALAQSYGNRLGADVVSLSAYQQFLPFLWRDGSLGGRRYEVLMTRLPIRELQRRLDVAASASPERKSLADFRAGDWMADAEAAALAEAERIITPHTEIAALFPEKAVLLPWVLPPVREVGPGSAIAFPGPAIARKGSEVVRDIARELDVKVVLAGSDLESPGFWDGVELRRPAPGSSWLDGVSCVVQPAVMEDQPRKLLQALACGVPVVATKECGIPEREGLTVAERGEFVSAVRAVLMGTRR